MDLLILCSIILIVIPSLVYLAYFSMILRTSKQKEYINTINNTITLNVNSNELPVVAILIPAYNEEEIIYNKIKNISEFTYPLERIEVIILNDSSTDNTINIAKSAMKEYHINGTILSNEVRSGVNFSYNNAIANVKPEFILTTDSDAIIPSNTLENLVKILLNMTNVGGVAAKMIPIQHNLTTTTKISTSYNSMSNSMLLAESSIFSTFPGSTSCMLMRKSAYMRMSDTHGSSDGNISLGVVKMGFKFIWAPSVVYYEPISENITEQRRQKIRRATRLIQSTLQNRDLLFSKKFGLFSNVIFPLRFLMMTVVPLLILSSIPIVFVTSILYFPNFFVLLLIIILLTIVGTIANISIFNLITSFLFHQVYLSIGLLTSYKSMNVWKKIERSEGIDPQLKN
jgi:poly-beta-1,6-N-acetyl-D-glucosamine synthase